MRTLPALLLTATLLAGLTSCAAGPFGGGCDSPVSAGDASAVVTASGKFDSRPTVEFPTPVVTKKLERSELIKGTGAQLLDGDTAMIKFTILSGATGAVLQQGDYAGSPLNITLGGSTIPAVSVGLQCATVGSRVAIVSSAESAGQPDVNAGGTGDAVVFVIDIVTSYPAKASGAPQIPQAGMPAVVTAPSGAPGVTVPKQDPPKDLKVNVLQAGSGDTLAADDHALLKYTAYLWADSSIVDSTWTKGDAKITTLTASGNVPEGLVKGLVGQKVGSQVLVVIPPADGYGDTGSNGVPPGSTLIYVVDILGLVS